MSTQQALVKSLLINLSKDVALYSDLESKLKLQYDYLLKRNAVALTELNTTLYAIMKQLKESATERCNSLIRLGLSADNHGMQKLLQALPSQISKTSSEQWQQLAQLTLNCQEINNQNGRLLSQQKQSLNKILNPEHQFFYTPSSIAK